MIGLWMIRVAAGVLEKQLARRDFDETLTPFLVNMTSWILKAVLFISVASMIGIQTTSLIALLGAAGLAVGLALQGSLANFAGGVLILLFRPYKVGDVIEAQGQIGSVVEIQIFTTVLLNGQNRRIILPNGPLSNGTIINYTAEKHVRVDMEIGIAYDADIAKAKSVLLALLDSDERVLKEPAPTVAVVNLADSSVNLVVRPYAKPNDYWAVLFDTLEKGKLALDAAGIGIPFPQRDVHLYEHKRPMLPARP
jgi:small conductance mechanosensitive channel